MFSVSETKRRNAQSAVLPESVRGIGEVIDAPYQEIRIPDAGHWVQQEAAEIVTDSLREFLAEV